MSYKLILSHTTNHMIYFFYAPLTNTLTNPWLTSSAETLDASSIGKGNESIIENKVIFSPTILHTPTVPQLESSSRTDSGSTIEKVFQLDKKRTLDEDYNPECQATVKNRKSKQLQNRNVVPNIVRLILSYVQKPGKSSKLVEGLLKKKNLQYATSKRFFLFQKLVKAKIDNYVNEQTLGELVKLRQDHLDVYSHEEQECYITITRRLILHFLNREAAACVLTSKRMEQAKKRDHITAIRCIIQRLRHTLRN